MKKLLKSFEKEANIIINPYKNNVFKKFYEDKFLNRYKNKVIITVFDKNNSFKYQKGGSFAKYEKKYLAKNKKKEIKKIDNESYYFYRMAVRKLFKKIHEQFIEYYIFNLFEFNVNDFEIYLISHIVTLKQFHYDKYHFNKLPKNKSNKIYLNLHINYSKFIKNIEILTKIMKKFMDNVKLGGDLIIYSQQPIFRNKLYYQTIKMLAAIEDY